MKVIIADTIHETLKNQLEEGGFDCYDASKLTEEGIVDQLSQFEGLVLRSKLSINKKLIDANPQLKFIGRVGAGLEHIDVDYCQTKGVQVLRSPEANRQAVAEHALGSLLALLNRITIADAEVRKGVWIRKQNEGQELQGKTVAIVGFGNTGEAFSKLLVGFSTPVIAYDKYKDGFNSSLAKEVAMEDVFKQADVVSIHLPLNEETRYLVNRDWIDKFRKPIILINTARGPIVNTSDLLEALDSGQVIGACLDVLEYETENLKMAPMDAIPESAHALLARKDVILTPHIAGLTKQSYFKLSAILADKIIAHFSPA